MSNDTATAPIVPVVGMPATINLYTDTQAAVVIRVNAKSVTVARVEIGEYVKNMLVDGANSPDCPPVMVAEGITDKIIGGGERFKRIEHSDGRVSYRNGSIGITLGRSISVRDYRY